LPESKQSFGNKIKAIKNLIKVIHQGTGYGNLRMAAILSSIYAWHEVRPRKCGMVKIHENQLNNNRYFFYEKFQCSKTTIRMII